MRKKNYLWYQLWRHAIVGSGLKLFYRKIQISGRDKLPTDKPLLFIPNHQNSFMDAFLVTTNLKPVMYFLTRAQAFKPPIMGWFLRSLNMLPVYRVRDGLSSVQKNNAIFDECFDYLNNNDTVLVFAEANHNLKRRIRPLSKGFTRIAFGAEEKYNWDLDLQIVPVGVNYSSHREARNHIHVKFGECIPVSKFKEAYTEDENEASQQMKEEVSDAMKDLVFHVENLDEYPVHKMLWEDLEPDDKVITDPALSNERIKNTEPRISDEIIGMAKEVYKLADKHDVSVKDLAVGTKLGFRDILLMPFYLFSLINNAIPYQPVRYLITKVIKDHAFDVSIKFVTGLFVQPLFYVIMSLILYFSGVSFPYIATYMGFSLITAPLFVRAKQLFLPGPSKKLAKKAPADLEKMESHIEAFKKLRHSIISE